MCNKLLSLLMLVFVIGGVVIAGTSEPNLLAFYRFDETSGTTAYDYSGNGYNGTVGSSSGWDSTGFYGNGCLDFSGTFNVAVPDGVVSGLSDKVTVSLWVKSDNPGTYANALFYGIDTNNNNTRVLGVELPGGDNLHLWFNAGSSGTSYDMYPYYNIANVVTFRGQWNNFTFTKDAAAGEMKIYVNGVLISTETGKTKTMENIVDFVIGSTPTGGWYFQGKMADFRLYDRVLSEEEIVDLAGTNLVGWWKLGENSGSTAYDSSSYRHDGTIGASDTWIAGGGLDFDGGSYGASGIVFANNGADLVADMALTSQVTVSYWGTWDAYVAGANYPFDGRNAGNVRMLSAECPTGNHLLNHFGGAVAAWTWEAFNDQHANFIFKNVDPAKTWGDMIMITETVDFTTGNYKLYVDGQLYASEGGKTGSFSTLANFTIGRTSGGEMEGSMEEFRIYNRALSADEVARLYEQYEIDYDVYLIGAWNFDEGTGSTVYDSTNNHNDGTKGTADSWITGGIDFAGSGNSGISFASNGLNIVSGLTDEVTISYVATWDSYAAHADFPYDGRDVSDVRLLTAECPTGDNILLRNGGDSMWCWSAFNDESSGFIFGSVGKTWGDDIRITTTADLSTGEWKLYVDDYLYASATGKTGSFADLVKFTIGQSTSGDAEMEGSMKDFRIYDKVLPYSEIVRINTPQTASQLIPRDGEVAAATEDGDVTLYWKHGINTDGSNGHDVYFGTSYNSVNNATHASGEYKGTQTATSYNLSALSEATTYYWRIDENAHSTVYKGDVQSFTISDVWLMDFSFVGNLGTADRICAYTIQGLMNQKGARVFIDVAGHNAGNSTADDYWVGYLHDEKGFTFANIFSLRELIAAARKEGVISGLTEYNPANIDTGEVTVAVNLAVDSNYVPVTAEMLNYTSTGLQYKGYIDCFNGLTINDISGTWATKLLAQSYGVTNLMPGTPTDGVFSCIRPFPTFDDGHNYDIGIDYGVQRKFYAYDMNYSNTGDERTLFNNVMSHLVKPGMSFGSWHDEGIDLEGISAAGNYTVLCGTNLSFWANVDYSPANLNMSRATSGMTLDTTKYYVMFQSSEGDTAGYLTGLQMSGTWEGAGSAWLKDNRGKGKVTWCTLPVAYDLWPALLEYYNTHGEPNDSFWTGPSGAGYTRPSSMPNLTNWAALTDSYLVDLGISGVEVWWGFSLSMYETFKTYAPHIKAFSHQGVSGGSNDWLKDGTPIVRSHATDPTSNGLWYAQLPDHNDIVTNITSFAATKTPPYFITVYDVPACTVDYAAICEDQLGSNFVIVRGVDFIDLMDQMVHPKPWGTLLTYDNFETGFGNYTDGGADCARYTGGITYARLGTCAIDLQDNSGTASSMYHTNGIDVHTPGYTHIKVTFWFKANSIETGEDLYVEYYNGSAWQTLTRYIAGTNMANGIFYRKTIDIYEGTYTFPTNMKLRFRSDASDDYDDFYIDCITVEAQ